jgi:hypothetical protein
MTHGQLSDPYPSVLDLIIEESQEWYLLVHA